MASGKAYLGTGMKFPPEIDKATGRFLTVTEDESVKESIYLILMTQRTERLTRPDFGSNIMDYTFMDTGTTMLSIMRRDLTQTILSQEPRVTDVEISTTLQERQGMIVVSINYRVAATNTVGNLVFPFYLDSAGMGAIGEEEPEFFDPDNVNMDMQIEEEIRG